MSLTRDLARLHLDSDGKVGIGTDTPQEHLEIKTANPALKITDTANSNNI